MIRAWILLVIVLGALVFLFFRSLKTKSIFLPKAKFSASARPAEIWSQLYETDSPEEMNSIRMRLGEETLNFVVFEQGKRDLEGKTLKNFGIVMPKSHLSRGQTILTRVLS